MASKLDWSVIIIITIILLIGAYLLINDVLIFS